MIIICQSLILFVANYILGRTYGYLVARIYKQSNFNSLISTSLVTGAEILIWMILFVFLSNFCWVCLELIVCNLYSSVIYVEGKFNGIIQRNKVIKLDIHKC